jgi:fibro-slime domain-containing protein
MSCGMTARRSPSSDPFVRDGGRVACSALVSWLALASAACGSGSNGFNLECGSGASGCDASASSDDAGNKSDSALFGSFDGSNGSNDAGVGLPGTLLGTVRDFRFWDGTSQTNPDFEDAPYGIDQSGNPSAGYSGDWNDLDIVADTLGADGKPVYKNPNGTPDANGRVTLTTHGQMWFDMWFHDTPEMNLSVTYPMTLKATSVNGQPGYGYDSNVSGVPYGFTSGSGFFPVDDGTPYGRPNHMTFGNQAIPQTSNYPPSQSVNAAVASMHNYSFTFELHTVFTYQGGEVFNFRGDDDVFVFIDNKLVINLGGIHSPETASVSVDSLGLTKGTKYPLDFFSVERHVSGSNILFTTTLVLQPTVQ